MTKQLKLFSMTARPGEICHVFAYDESEARAHYATSLFGNIPIRKIEVTKATPRQVAAYRNRKVAA